MAETRTGHGHRRGRWLLTATTAALLLLGLGAAVRAHPAAAASTLRSAADARGRAIGTAVQAGALSSDAKYSAGVAREFNAVTPENEMKWDSVEPTRGQLNFAAADAIVASAMANSQRVRGHNLIWHQQLPNWLTSGGFTAAQLNTILQQHIATEAGRYAGKIAAWDVVNEPFNEDGTLRSSIWQQNLGQGYIATALTAARAADPAARLYLNDFNIEGVNAKSTAMLNLVTSLKQQGVPIDGVGLESHFILGQVPSTLQQNIARFAALGVDVWITELDVRMTLPADATKLAQQASDYTAVVNACLAVARCVGVTVWEYTDKLSWVPGAFSGQGAADLFDANIDPKPAYGAVLQALGGTPPTPTPTPTGSPTATPTPTGTPTPTPRGTPGAVTATPVVAASGPWFDEEDLRLSTSGSVTALTVTIVVQRTGGVSFSGQYNTVGGQVLQSNSSTATAVTYTYALASGQTLAAGSPLFAAQLRGSGTTHPTSADTFSVTLTSGGASSTLSGHF
jgi:endo-1,4-beta-xylanase